MVTKTCTKCKIEKDESGFHFSGTDKSGLQAWCADCHSVYFRGWWQINGLDQLNKTRLKYALGRGGDFKLNPKGPVEWLAR